MTRREDGWRHGAARPGALVLAAGVAVAFGVGVAWLMLSHRGTGKPASLPGSMEPPPDVKSAAGGGGAVAGGTELLITLVDPREPSRVEYEITAEKSEPLPSGLHRMTRPRAWRFLRDGRSMLVEAERGQAAIPTGKEAKRPEQAVLEGGVTVREYARLEGGRRPIAGVDEPVLTIRTNLLRFDGVRNEVEFPERFDVESVTVRVAARGLTAAFNEEARRLEWMKVERQLTPLVYVPREAPRREITPTPATPSDRGTARTQEAGAGTPRAAEAPARTCYHAVFGGDVLVAQQDAAVVAPGAETWMRLEGDSLRPGAIAAGGTPTSPSRAGTPAVGLLEAVVATQPGVAARASKAGGGPVSIVWTGPLDVRALPSDPAELARDDVYVRLGTDPKGVGRLLDGASNTRASAGSIVYAATTRRGWLLGREGMPATAEQIGTGTISAPTLTMDLATGVARATGGPGWLVPSGWDSAGRARSVAWTEQGEFTFAIKPGGEVSRLLRADLAGQVEGRDGAASLSGERLHALFDGGEGAASRLSSLKVIGQVAGSDGAGSSLAGDVLDATFDAAEGGTAPKPAKVTIQGHAGASQGESRLSAGRIDAVLADDAAGRRAVRGVTAETGVEFLGADGLKARCDRLEADAVARTAHLSGAGAVIEHPEGSVRGASIHLNEQARTLRVEGEGLLEHAVAAEGDLPAGLMVTAWKRGMTFDDTSGVGTCEGAVVATLTRGEVVRDTVSAEAVHLGVTPRPAEGAPARMKRALLSSRATGTPESPAKVEMRRYAIADSGPTLERLFYLEGATIVGDVTAGTLDVPTPGKALSLDRRKAATGGATAEPFSLSTAAGRGTALLTWLGSMHVERGEGTVKVNGGVRLVHDRGAGADRAVLDCQSLTARFREGKAPDNGKAEAVGGELVSASAAGGVTLRSGGKTMTAPTLEYDAIGEVAEATGADGALVTVTEAGQASPLTAGKMRWDLKNGRIEVLQARPVTGPR